MILSAVRSILVRERLKCLRNSRKRDALVCLQRASVMMKSKNEEYVLKNQNNDDKIAGSL